VPSCPDGAFHWQHPHSCLSLLALTLTSSHWHINRYFAQQPASIPQATSLHLFENMSIKINIDDPNTGRHYELEVPLGSIAATCAQTPYQETQQMVTDFTHRSVQACLAGAPSYFNSAFDRGPARATVEILDRRLLDSCYVQRATGKEALQDRESLVIGVQEPRRVLWYICKKHTPLRRVLNAYAGERKKDVKLFQLTWEGEVIGYSATAEDVSCCCDFVT